jgi:hypothetical protein
MISDREQALPPGKERIVAEQSRGMAQRSLDLIEAMYAVTKAAQPITGRGVGYKLFTAGLIPSMARSEMQPVRCEVWSEKGTVRGVLQPVLDKYAVGFRVLHGFSGATTVHDVAEDDDGRELIVLYVGDFDPSGMFMSEADLPKRLSEYGGDHVTLKRIALTRSQVRGLPSFPATDKKKDPRFKWFRSNHGNWCWELDAMDPNDLRDCVEKAIKKLIEPVAWKRCEIVNRAEQESLKTVLAKWGRISERTIFTLRIAGKPGTAGIYALRFLLKRLLRQYGFRCLDIREEAAPAPDVSNQVADAFGQLRRDIRNRLGGRSS